MEIPAPPPESGPDDDPAEAQDLDEETRDPNVDNMVPTDA